MAASTQPPTTATSASRSPRPTFSVRGLAPPNPGGIVGTGGAPNVVSGPPKDAFGSSDPYVGGGPWTGAEAGEYAPYPGCAYGRAVTGGSSSEDGAAYGLNVSFGARPAGGGTGDARVWNGVGDGWLGGTNDGADKE
jgi:hypothetical protein